MDPASKGSAIQALRQLALRLGSLSPIQTKQLALLGMALGAAYSLREAVERGYTDKTGPRDLVAYRDYLRSRALVFACPDWNASSLDVSEYFLNSAILRIAVLSELLDKYAGTRRDLARSIRREANRFKHELTSLSTHRTVTLSDTIRTLEQLVELIEDIC
jgi:uncharacterized protein (UPF0147 family)